MDNVAVLVEAVKGFEDQQEKWTDDLDRVIKHIAATADILASWEKVKKVVMKKLQLVLDEFHDTNPYKPGKVNANASNDDFDEMKKRLIQLAEDFDEPPFTIQRICELLTEPMRNYTKCDKFMRALEKCLMVVTSWSYPTRRTSTGNETVMNGITIGPRNGFSNNDRLEPHWANLPPSPVATGPPKIPGAPDFSQSTEIDDKNKEATPQRSEEAASEQTGVPILRLQEGDADGEQQADKKSNVSATIISSSPATTINIKRKIDESSEEDSFESSDELPESSPKKRVKSDTEESNTQSDIDENESSMTDTATIDSKKENLTDTDDNAESKTEEAVESKASPNEQGSSIDQPSNPDDSAMDVD